MDGSSTVLYSRHPDFIKTFCFVSEPRILFAFFACLFQFFCSKRVRDEILMHDAIFRILLSGDFTQTLNVTCGFFFAVTLLRVFLFYAIIFFMTSSWG